MADRVSDWRDWRVRSLPSATRTMQSTAMLVSLRQCERPTMPEALPLLKRGGAGVVLGGPITDVTHSTAIAVADNTLFGPRAASLAGDRGPLLVADTGHHRLLLWRQTPVVDGTPADLVIGQARFSGQGRNAGFGIGPTTLNAPAGVASDGEILALADAWNHRVLLWHGLPRYSNQPADVVLGQEDFRSGNPNRGLGQPTAASLNWCSGVAIHKGRLYVADTGNRRVVMWEKVPLSNGAPADLVLGQRDFTTRDTEAGAETGPRGMRWPHAIAAVADMLFVADAGSSRIMGWRGQPVVNGAACDIVLGQKSLTGSNHNRGRGVPTDATLNMPYGLALAGDVLLVADTANSRLLGFDLPQLSMGIAASRLSGQPTFSENGENRWKSATRDITVLAVRDHLYQEHGCHCRFR